MKTSKLGYVVLAACISAGLAGCGGGGSADTTTPFNPPDTSQPGQTPGDNGGGNPPGDDGGTTPEPGDPSSKLMLKWAPNPQPVIGYHVYYGATPDRTKMHPLPVPANLNLAAPSVEYDILSDLGALPGQGICFRVRAYSYVAESDFSQALCATI